MTAKNIWAITAIAICTTMLINLGVFVWVRYSPGLVRSPTLVNTVFIIALLTALLRIWSIGLLYRRAFDLYVISLACWLALMSMRPDDLYPPGPLLVWFALLAGLAVDAVQVRALRAAITRSAKTTTPA